MKTHPFSPDAPLRLRNMRPKVQDLPRGKNGRPYSVCTPEMAQTFRILHADGQGMKLCDIARRYNVDPRLVRYHVANGKDYDVPTWLVKVQQAVTAAIAGEIGSAREMFATAAELVAAPPASDWRQLQLL